MIGIRRFLLIESNSFDNFLSRVMIRHIDDKVRIKSFKNPGECFSFIKESYSTQKEIPTVILIDINMPGLMSWEFIENIKSLPEEIRNQFELYILSSAIDGSDKKKIVANSLIKGYIQKPIEKEVAQELITPRILQRPVGETANQARVFETFESSSISQQ